MKHPTVYELLQTQKGDKQVARLIHALDELAGRIESVSGYEVAAQPVAQGTGPSASNSRVRRTGHGGWDLKDLQLPDPTSGTLPLLPCASEFEALQSAATTTAAQIRSTADRHAWRSWVMKPSHFVCVIQAAWLLLALVFKQDDPNAKPLQDFVFRQLAQHYVSQVLAGQAEVENAAVLWTQAIAGAACRLLRSAFPGASELQDPQLQQLLQRQLRLWTTGVLPSDAATSLLASQQQDDEHDTTEIKTKRYTTAPFVSVKPGPLVSSYMASKGLKPVDLLHKQGAKVTQLTVPHDQLQQQQQAPQKQQLPRQPMQRSSSQQQRHQQGTARKLQSSSSARSQCTLQQIQQRVNNVNAVGSATQHSQVSKQSSMSSLAGKKPAKSISSSTVNSSDVLDSTLAADAPNGSIAGYAAKAAACLAAASDAAEQYERSKKAAAAAASKGSKVVQQQLRGLAQKRDEMLFGTRAKVQDASNNISGWLSESSAATTTVPATATDAQCKAQRQLMAGHLRGTEWRMAHAFNSAVHDKCLDMAATVAATEPAAADAALASSESSAYANVVGGKWAAIAGHSMASKRLQNAKGGSSSAAGSSSHDVKVMKAAKAIVEDVQRKFAAAPAQLPGRR